MKFTSSSSASASLPLVSTELGEGAFMMSRSPEVNANDGLIGLCNLGNTCYMNTGIQCLAHTEQLVNFFLRGFEEHINVDNLLGTEGKLATAFGHLLRNLWAPETSSPISPREFKSVISKFASQFSGNNQHDCQEFIAFLLDGLHEDLNRVTSKPYTESLDDGSQTEDILAEHYWQYHLARNSSIIVDLCQGQYRSTLACPDCQKRSVTFDPFMCLSLPIPPKTTRTMTFTIVSSHGTFMPYQVTIRVPQHGSYADLLRALISACKLRKDETLLMVEIHDNSILRILSTPSESIKEIADKGRFVAYRMLKKEVGPLIEFRHCEEEALVLSRSPMLPKKFGFPLVGRIPNFSQGSNIRKLFLNLINPFSLPLEESICKEEAEMVERSVCSDNENNLHFVLDFQYNQRDYTIQMDEPVPVPGGCKLAKVQVYWSPKMIKKYDTALLSHIPEVSKEAVTLDECLQAFLKEEPLGPENKWYCPTCMESKQANKKLDIWRLPEILVIHLKRFSHNKDSRNKLKIFVDFPINDFDLSSFLTHKCDTFSHHYSLYAVSNHSGEMSAGHYTAFAQLKPKKWYMFDDANVFAVKEDEIATEAAYVLFYKRI